MSDGNHTLVGGDNAPCSHAPRLAYRLSRSCRAGDFPALPACGAVLTAPYLAESTNWLLSGSYLTKHFGSEPDRELKNRIKVGSAYAYCYVELLVLRDRKTANAATREEAD